MSEGFRERSKTFGMISDKRWSSTTGFNEIGGQFVEESRKGWICWYRDIMIPEDGEKVIRRFCRAKVWKGPIKTGFDYRSEVKTVEWAS